MNKGAKVLTLSIISVLLIIFMLNAIGGRSAPFDLSGETIKEFTTSELIAEIDAGNVEKVEWRQSEMTGTLNDQTKFKARVPDAQSAASTALTGKLEASGTPFDIMKPPVSQSVLPMMGMIILPILILVFIWMFLIRPAQAGGNQAMSFGRSKARRATEQNPKITFDDVAGIDEAKQELSEIVDFLKNTKKYVQLGAKIPKGILLTGPPGVGKTHLARAIAGEAGVPFFHISGSDFVEMFVGVGAARVRDLFETAKAHRPCLIFVDEIDAVGRQRGAGMGGGHDEREQTLNQLLVEMDGFDANTGVIMIAATNRPDVLDPALLRPGRFDRQVVVDPPDATGREHILKIHAKGKPLEENVDLAIIAKRTPGFTGADLANSINEAALLAARRNRTKIEMSDMEEALDRVMAGPQRKSRVIDQKEREVIAYHEAGHAIVGELLKNCDPIHKVTVLPRGMSLGSTWALPEKDTYLVSEQALLDNIAMTLGGRVAEEIVFNEIYTGAASDLDRVAKVARAMVTEYGMSKKLGTLAIGRRSRSPFLGRDYHNEDRDYSEEVARLIDQEVKTIVEDARMRAEQILRDNREKLDNVVVALLERETLSRDEFLAVLNGEPLPELPKSDPPVESETEAKEDADSGAKSKHQGRLEPDPA